MTLRDLFLRAVQEHATGSFVSDGTRHLTYQAALEQIYARSQYFREIGVQVRERVVIVDASPLETTLWLLACIFRGVVFVILHQSVSANRLSYILNDIKPTGVIDLRPGVERFYGETKDLRFVMTTPGDWSYQKPFPALPMPDLLETDPAFLVYTSGSTGMPKAVICSHRSVIWVTGSINSYLPNRREDRIAHSLSLAFVYGLYQLFLAMHVQASIVFLKYVHSGNELLLQLATLQITAFPTIRPVFVFLSRLSEPMYLPASLKYLTCAGDYLPVPLLGKIFPLLRKNQQLFTMYGLSECARALYMPPERLSQKPEATGIAIPGTRAYVLDAKGLPCPTGIVGELFVEGPHVMNGYWGASEETQRRFVSGMYGQPQLRTDDLFFQDSAGDFHFVGRKSDLIKHKGFRISPYEVETALMAADSTVQECIAYGVEDELLGQAIHAQVVVNNPAHSVQVIYARCRKAMEPHLIPQKIQIVSILPMTATGKYFRRNDVVHRN